MNKQSNTTDGRTRAKRQTTKNQYDHEWLVDQPWCTQLLLEQEEFYPQVCDPHCGGGNITDVCVKAGYMVFATDIVNRGYDLFRGERDFLDVNTNHDWPYADFIMNPAYDRGVGTLASIVRALDLSQGKVAVLVNETFVYSDGRYSLFEGPERLPLSRIYFFSSRPSMPPGGQGIEHYGGTANYMYLVFDKNDPALKAPRWLQVPQNLGSGHPCAIRRGKSKGAFDRRNNWIPDSHWQPLGPRQSKQAAE